MGYQYVSHNSAIARRASPDVACPAARMTVQWVVANMREFDDMGRGLLRAHGLPALLAPVLLPVLLPQPGVLARQVDLPALDERLLDVARRFQDIAVGDNQRRVLARFE